jgi:LysM repeat protein
MKAKLTLIGLLCMVAALPLAGLASASAPAQPAAVDGPNLLVNPGFESPYSKQCCHTDPNYFPNTPIDEVQVAAGWLGWWLQPGLDAAHPESCERIVGPCKAWHRPEWREANCGAACAGRWRTGDNAQKYFTFWSLHDAGMYQQVSGIRPGALLRFNTFMQGWSTNANYGPSDYAQSMHLRVGIDPTGGTNPYSANVIWSPPGESFDAWGLFQVEAVARASTVTVFTRSTPVYPIQHVDVYVDDASLVVVGGGGAAIAPAGRPANAPLAPTPRPTTAGNIVPGEVRPTASADGNIYYVIRPGDTLTHIAARFGTTVARLKQLNGWTGNVIIYSGRTMIIGP